MKYFFYGLCFISIFITCKKKNSSVNNNKSNSYTNSFQINKSYTQIKITTKNSTIHFKNSDLPIKNCIIGSSSLIKYVESLNKLETVKGIIDSKSFYSKKLHHQIKNQKTIDVGENQFLEIEKIIQLKPQVIISNYNPNSIETFNRLKEQNIQVLYIDDYLENFPLGKAELIKIFGVLFKKEKQALNIFTQIEKNYNFWKNQAKKQEKKPKVFGKIMYGDFWYMPQSTNYSAKFYEDAGGNYLWKDLKGNQSQSLSFEEVFSKGKTADYWLDASDFTTKNQLLIHHHQYSWFDAFKKNNVFSLSKRRNNKGSNDYYETGNLHVDSVLMDYVSILHPDLLPNYTTKFIERLK